MDAAGVEAIAGTDADGGALEKGDKVEEDKEDDKDGEREDGDKESESVSASVEMDAWEVKKEAEQSEDVG